MVKSHSESFVSKKRIIFLCKNAFGMSRERKSLRMKNNKSNIASRVEELISPVADDMGYYLWDVEFVKEGADKYLRITIDTEEGITIDDCEKFHRAIDTVLDEADPISEPYILEVSSPGIERELKTDAHIEACEGWDVEVKLYAPENGSKVYRGVLGGLNEDGNSVFITLQDGREISFPKEKIAKVSTYFDFD